MSVAIWTYKNDSVVRLPVLPLQCQALVRRSWTWRGELDIVCRRKLRLGEGYDVNVSWRTVIRPCGNFLLIEAVVAS